MFRDGTLYSVHGLNGIGEKRYGRVFVLDGVDTGIFGVLISTKYDDFFLSDGEIR